MCNGDVNLRILHICRCNPRVQRAKNIVHESSVACRRGFFGGRCPCKKSDCFALPPRKETRQFHRHGLHFTKMLPIDKSYFEKYNYPLNNASAAITMAYIQKNFKQLIKQAQGYINCFSTGYRPLLCVDIDAVHDAVNACDATT